MFWYGQFLSTSAGSIHLCTRGTFLHCHLIVCSNQCWHRPISWFYPPQVRVIFTISNRSEIFAGAHQPELTCSSRSTDQRCLCESKHQVGTGETQSCPGYKHNHRWHHYEAETGRLMSFLVLQLCFPPYPNSRMAHSNIKPARFRSVRVSWLKFAVASSRGAKCGRTKKEERTLRLDRKHQAHRVNKVSQHSPQWIFQMTYFSGRGRKACWERSDLIWAAGWIPCTM